MSHPVFCSREDRYHRCPDALERFWAKVRKTDSCWVWTASNARGYGQFRAHRGGRPSMAHRYAYAALVGPIPEGLQLDHLCRNPGCVNPDHLEPVTPRENVLRSESWAARAARQTLCVHGHELDQIDRGHRRCGTCGRQHTREYMRRQRYARSDARAAEREAAGLPPNPRRWRLRAS